MALRLVEITLPSDLGDELCTVIETALPGAAYDHTRADGSIRARVVIDAEKTGPMIDAVGARFGAVTGFQLVVLAVETALPRVETPAPPEAPPPGAASGETADGETAPAKVVAGGVSRDEMHEDVLDMTRVSRVYVVTVVLSTVVAGIGLIRDDVAVVIGAMVIAPLLGPNVALAFATTLGDVKLIRRSVWANFVGFMIAIVISALLGAVYPGDLHTAEMTSRTVAGASDIALALAAGGAGALAITSGVSAALTGVMVAVALLPPTAAAGVMLGIADWEKAAGAGLLLATNVICVNLAGVLVFVVQGVNPASWWEKDRARRSTRIAVAIWITLLLVLSALIVLPR